MLAKLVSTRQYDWRRYDVLLLAALNMSGSWAQLVVGAGMVIVALMGLCVRLYVLLRRGKNALDASVSCYAAPGPAAARRC